MATVNLGSIKFNWQGAYDGATAYAVDDVVSYNGSSYICKLASTGNVPTNTTYFDQMSSAGTDGTDLTSTLTTQGDILYRDGSGLQRLGAGTSGQVLQTGGAGANPSWGTVSSDYVKLGETGSFSNVASVDLNGFFSSTYDIYKIYGYQIYGASAGNGFAWRANTGVSYTTDTSSLYTYANDGYYKASASNGVNSNHEWQGSSGCRIGWSGGGSSSAGNDWELTLYRPQITTDYKKATFTNVGWDGGSTVYGMTGGNIWISTTAMTGINFYAYGGNMWGDNIQIYGIKA